MVEEYECDLCTTIFSSKNDIEQHWRTHLSIVEENELNYDIQSTDQLCMTFSKECKSKTDELNFTCSKCRLQFDNYKLFDVHRSQNNCTGKKNGHFKCGKCDKAFMNLKEWSNHEEIHLSPTPFRCAICLIEYREFRLYRKHIKSNHISTNCQVDYECNTCNKTFKGALDRLKHEEDCHMDMTPFKCFTCDTGFLRACHLKRHKHTSKHIQTNGEHDKDKLKQANSAKSTVQIKSHKLPAHHVQEECEEKLKRRFKCGKCNKDFTNFNEWSDHEEIHVNPTPFRCAICLAEYNDIRFYRKHVGKYHMLTNCQVDYECNTCNKTFKGTLERLKHEEDCHMDMQPFKCFTCDKGFERACYLKRHKHKVHAFVIYNRKSQSTTKHQIVYKRTGKAGVEDKLRQTADKTHSVEPTVPLESYDLSANREQGNYEEKVTADYNCRKCDVVCSSYNDLSVQEELYLNLTPFRCVVCQKKFRSFSYYLKHTRKEHTHCLDQYECSSCNIKTFEGALDRLKHEEDFHMDMKPFKCSSCNAGFSRFDHLNLHKYRMHSLRNKKDDRQESKTLNRSMKENKGQRKRQKDQPWKYLCEFCGCLKQDYGNLKSHYRLMHPEGTKSFKCRTCKSCFPNAESLLRHRYLCREVSKHFKCEECNRGFLSEYGVKMHLRRCHIEKENKFPCNKCGKKFATKSLLRIHYNVHMADTKPYKCEQCDVRFKQRCNLNKHRVIHTGAKPYKCDMCPSAYNHRSTLLKHKYVHNGNFPYKCNVCSRGFVKLRDLLDHKKKHEGLSKYTNCK